MARSLVKCLASLFAICLILVGCQDNPTAPSQEDNSEVVTNLSNRKATATACDVNVPSDESTIQGAVNSATAGATVCVEGGTYREQVIITKDLTLSGENDPTIEYPDSPEAYTINESGPSWEPIVFAYGGTASSTGVISGSETIDVSVTGFRIDGREEQPDARRKVGIFFRNVQSTGGITGNTVENMGVGGKETFGILAYGNTETTITENIVSEYERGGIGANGDGGAHPAPDVAITNNDVRGSTGIGEAWGPNGIQIGFGATGRITDNLVQDNRYSESSAVASCILVFESAGVSVKNNSVSNCDVGMGVGTWGGFRPSADENQIIGNEVSESLFAATLNAVAFDGFTSTDPLLNNNKVTNNTLDGGDMGKTGIRISVVDDSENYDPVADNNKLVNNTITDFGTEVQEQGTDTKVQANDQPATP